MSAIQRGTDQNLAGIVDARGTGVGNQGDIAGIEMFDHSINVSRRRVAMKSQHLRLSINAVQEFSSDARILRD